MTEVVNVRSVRGDETYIYIGRPTQFGNPFSHLPGTLAEHRVATREEAISKYREYFEARIAADPRFRAAVEELRGKRLGCYCTPMACHGDVIVEFLRRVEQRGLPSALGEPPGGARRRQG